MKGADYSATRNAIRALLKAGDIAAACEVWQRYDEAQTVSVLDRTMGFVDRDQWKRSVIEDVTRILAAGVSTASLELATAKFFGEPARGAEQRALNTRVAFLRDMDSWRELDYVLDEAATRRKRRCRVEFKM